MKTHFKKALFYLGEMYTDFIVFTENFETAKVQEPKSENGSFFKLFRFQFFKFFEVLCS